MKFNSNNYKTYFAYERFQALSEEERSDLIKFTVEQIRQEKGLKRVDVSFKEMNPGSRGSCSQKYNFFNHFEGHQMILNKDILSTQQPIASYSVYNTINHELEHADQYEHAANRSIDNSDAATLEQRLNDEHYYSASGDRIVKTQDGNYRTVRFDSETDFQLYRAQACEADARAAGLKAVEELQESNLKQGIQDEYIEDYLDYSKTNELIENREMLHRLGMHSRENMAREELSHISTQRVSEEDRKKVIEYARNKDYETAKSVLEQDYRGQLTEEQLRRHFDNNEDYNDFYQSETYRELKVQDSERKDYKFSRYKWDEQDANETESSAQRRDLYRNATDTGQQGLSDEEKRVRFRETMKGNVRASNENEQRASFSDTMNGVSNTVNDNPQAKGAEIKNDRS